MIEVGVRELKNKLSGYLRRVERGETLVVTARGKPIARILPAGIPEDLAPLVAEGKITWHTKTYEPVRRRIKMKPGPPLSDYISEDRD